MISTSARFSISSYPYKHPNSATHEWHPFCSKLCNPFRVDAVMLRIAPGCAARPRALLLDCFAVTQTISTNPKRGSTSKPRVAYRTLG